MSWPAARVPPRSIASSGAVQCVGGDYEGELGNGTNGFSDVPVAVNGLSDATAVSSGFYYVCALVALGAAKCWGLGQSGQLGTGSSASHGCAPTGSPGARDARISAGNDDTCVIGHPMKG